MIFSLVKNNRVLEWLQGSGVERVSFAFSAVVVIWIAWQLAVLAWSFIPVAQLPAVTIITELSSVGKRPLDKQSILVRQLASWHLFGEAEKKSLAPKPQQLMNAPETRLKLVLVGVFSAETTDLARAIIADVKGNQLTYSIGSQLPGGAELSEVFADRVILLRNGRPETLFLLKDKSKNMFGSSPSRTSRVKKNRGRASSAPAAVDILKDYRASLTTNPRRLMELVQAVPETRDGQFMGFKLYPGRKPRLFGQLGLQRGDIVTSVNGITMDSPERGFSALNSLSQSEQLDLIVLRKGQEVPISFAAE
ncbi:MAG: type II secretion system protein GspC [Gammaproteobacteria bacterium]|nr:type II secretion system protein GspC [Gammaproteobacteria bacterium]